MIGDCRPPISEDYYPRYTDHCSLIAQRVSIRNLLSVLYSAIYSHYCCYILIHCAACTQVDHPPSFILAPTISTFLAPTGAQGVTLSVCPSVRPLQSVLSSSIWLKSLSNQSAVSQQSVSSQSAVSQQSVSNQSAVSQQSVSSQSVSQSLEEQFI